MKTKQIIQASTFTVLLAVAYSLMFVIEANRGV